MIKDITKSLFIQRHRLALILCLGMLIACGTVLNAQSSAVYSEKKKLGYTQDTIAINELIRLADTVLRRNLDSGKQLMIEAGNLSKSIGFNKGALVTLGKIALEYGDRGSVDSELVYFLHALKFTRDPLLFKNYGAILYNNIGSCYDDQRKYSNALQYYNRALMALGAGSRKNRTTDSIGMYGNIGSIWLSVKNNKIAREYFQLARKLAEHDNNPVRLAMAYHNIAASYNNDNNLALAESWYLAALALERKHAIQESEVVTLSNLAIIASKNKDFTKALAYMEQVFAIPGFAKLPIYRKRGANAALGHVYMRMKAYDKARPVIFKSYFEAEKSGDKPLMMELQWSMARLYEMEGRYKNAYQHQTLYLDNQTALLNKEMASFLDVWASAQKAENDKALLAKELNITRQKSQLQQQNWLISGGILGGLLLLSIIVMLIRNRQHKQAIIYQLQQSREIDQLKAQMRGEEQERQRIAHQLHDGIASQLWGIRLNVDNLQQLITENEGHGKQLGHIYQQLTDASLDVRKTAHNLLPDLLLDEGLVTALASICEMTRRNTRLEVDFQEYGVIPEMNKDIELSIYRMVQELIQNVWKHAVDATYLLVQISCVNTLLDITVEDNGKSFSRDDKQDGMGLQQIKKRTLALKGRFELENVPGKGTTVYLEFDLQHLL